MNFIKKQAQRKLSYLFLPVLTVSFIFLIDRMSAAPYKIGNSAMPTSSLIPYPTEFNFRQTLNDCGPFNVAAVVRALGNTEVSSAEFSENMSWRLPNNYTLPLGMEKQLKENGIAIEVPNVADLSGLDKVIFLQEQLSQKKPVIILGERNDYEHYLTLLGFDATKDEFYVYDSLYEAGEAGLTLDTSGDFPGNSTLSSQEILDFWGGGGIFGFYNWYSIVAEPL